MSKQQDTEDHRPTMWKLREFWSTPYHRPADLLEVATWIDQQKAEAADQAVREFAAELQTNLNWVHVNSPQAALAVAKGILEQFLGKGKV